MTTKLKPGKMWDHEGTYMGGIGFKYRGHVVVCEVTDDSELRRALLPSLLGMCTIDMSVNTACSYRGWRQATGCTLCSSSYCSLTVTTNCIMEGSQRAAGYASKY